MRAVCRVSFGRGKLFRLRRVKMTILLPSLDNDLRSDDTNRELYVEAYASEYEPPQEGSAEIPE